MARQICLYSVPQGLYNCQNVATTDAYQAVDQLLDNPHHSPIANDLAKTPIRKLLSIHNPEGMRDRGQIQRMASQITAGKDVADQSGLPNIKMIIAPNGQPLLFDGHHSALAYLRVGRVLLQDIPHIVFSGEKFTSTTPEEIARFFHPRDKEKVIGDWFGWVVNWQAENEKLEKRKIETIAQLADALSN